jgi:outer membrane protein assembly factor BamD (BamD/ComL family)
MNCLKRIGLILFVIQMMIFTGCKPSRDKSMQEIQSLESDLYSPTAVTFDKERADKLLQRYDKFIKDFPADTLVPVYLFKSANLEMNGTNAEGAVSRFDQLIREYPSNPKAATSMFFKGYIYENMLKDLDKAKEAYLLFIEKYPDHELVKDARMSIQNLGKTPEQMVREFEMMQKYDSVRKADSIANLKQKKRSK